MPDTQFAYKYLNADGTPCNGGKDVWSLPKDTHPGKWMPPIKNIVPCKRGYHLCREQDLLLWYGPVLALAEYRGKSIIHEDSKLVVEQARIVKVYSTWNARTQHLFARDCAERVAHLANGEARAAAGATRAAELAAGVGGTGVTLAARRAAGWAAWDAAGATWAATRDAGATRDAAWDAAYATERQWQLTRLLDYIEGRAG